jgi:hypothetical protein
VIFASLSGSRKVALVLPRRSTFKEYATVDRKSSEPRLIEKNTPTF